jgi:hypothetical protein
VISEIDIWRAAALMMKRFGNNAPIESGKRADEFANAGDDVTNLRTGDLRTLRVCGYPMSIP